MPITNPFTRMVLNTDVPNPKGCNQWTGPNCHKVFHGTSDSVDEFRVPGSTFASDPERASFYIRQGGHSGRGMPSIYKALVLSKKPHLVGTTESMREAVSEASRNPKFRRRLIEEGFDSLATGRPGLDHEAAISPLLTKDQVKILDRLTHWGALSRPGKVVPQDWIDKDDPELIDPEEYEDLMTKIKGKGFDEYLEKLQRRALMFKR